MTVQSQTERRFDGSSPVARYWLAQCEGFRVKGRLSGTVEKVIGSADEQSAETLVVQGENDPFGTPPDSPNRIVARVPGTHSLRDGERVAAVVAEWLATLREAYEAGLVRPRAQ